MIVTRNQKYTRNKFKYWFYYKNKWGTPPTQVTPPEVPPVTPPEEPPVTQPEIPPEEAPVTPTEDRWQILLDKLDLIITMLEARVE